MQIFEELQARGLLAQLTDEDEIRDLVNNGKATFYIGFDPTADGDRRFCKLFRFLIKFLNHGSFHRLFLFSSCDSFF